MGVGSELGLDYSAASWLVLVSGLGLGLGIQQFGWCWCRADTQLK